MYSNEDLNPMSNMGGPMITKWTQMKARISWALWMDKWCQNEHKWRLEYHEQYWWTNDAKMNSNDDLNTMSNRDGQIMPKWTQMKARIPWAIWMDKWWQNELKWRVEYHEQYGWTNDAKMNSNEDKWQYGLTNDAKMNSNEDLNPMSNSDGQIMPKCTQMKIWIPWAIWVDQWLQNELKWMLESHEHYGWTNDAKMNTNDDLSIMSNMDGQMMPKWTQMKTWIPWAILMDKWCQNELKWTQMKTWIPWAIWMDKWCQNELKWRQMAIWMDKWCQNELKWRLESHEQYGWTNDYKMNSNEGSNPMSIMDGQMMPKWTQMKTWIPWAIWMDKWCQNELKLRRESHEQYGWTNDAKMNSNDDLNIMSNMDGQMMPKWTQMKTWIPWAILMDKWCQNEIKWTQMNSKWWLEYHEQYGWTNDAKINTNDDLNIMSNMDGPMMPKWTQMKTWIPWAILMDKWCQNELKWTQMKTWISWAIWMDKWCQNELKWRLESHEQYGWTNDSKMKSNEDLNIMSSMDGQMMPKWTQMKTLIPWAIWMDKWCQNELK